MPLEHAQVRTVKISLTFIECQSFAPDTLSCNTCTGEDTCTDCASNRVMYNGNLCISLDGADIDT